MFNNGRYNLIAILGSVLLLSAGASAGNPAQRVERLDDRVRGSVVVRVGIEGVVPPTKQYPKLPVEIMKKTEEGELMVVAKGVIDPGVGTLTIDGIEPNYYTVSVQLYDLHFHIAYRGTATVTVYAGEKNKVSVHVGARHMQD